MDGTRRSNTWIPQSYNRRWILDINQEPQDLLSNVATTKARNSTTRSWKPDRSNYGVLPPQIQTKRADYTFYCTCPINRRSNRRLRCQLPHSRSYLLSCSCREPTTIRRHYTIMLS